MDKQPSVDGNEEESVTLQSIAATLRAMNKRVAALEHRLFGVDEVTQEVSKYRQQRVPLRTVGDAIKTYRALGGGYQPTQRELEAAEILLTPPSGGSAVTYNASGATTSRHKGTLAESAAELVSAMQEADEVNESALASLEDSAALIKALTEENAALNKALLSINGLIGNTDHSQGHGVNASKYRGDLLNDIRALITSFLAGSKLPAYVDKATQGRLDAVLEQVKDLRSVCAFVAVRLEQHEVALDPRDRKQAFADIRGTITDTINKWKIEL